MRMIEYFKEKIIFIIINIIVLIITSYLLFGLNVSSSAIVLIGILNFGYVSYLRDRYDIKTTTP